MSSGRRFPNLLLAVMVLLTLLGIALFFIAATARSLQQVLREAAERERARNALEQMSRALEQYHQSIDPSAPGEPSPPNGLHDDAQKTAAEPAPVQGEFRLNEAWSVTLPETFKRRIEDGQLILWRPGLTIWIILWNSGADESKEARLAGLRSGISPRAFGVEQTSEGELLRLAYRLDEEADDGRRPAFYGLAVGATGHVQMAAYFDDENDLPTAQRIWQSLSEQPTAAP